MMQPCCMTCWLMFLCLGARGGHHGGRGTTAGSVFYQVCLCTDSYILWKNCSTSSFCNPYLEISMLSHSISFHLEYLSRCPSSSKRIKRIYRYINLYYSISSVTFSVFSVSIWYLIRFWKNNIISNNILMLLNIFNIYFDLYNLLANILLFFSWHCIVSRCTLLYSYRILFGEN